MKNKYHEMPTEAMEQEWLMQWAVLSEGKYPELRLLYHIPNGGSRNKIEAANLKRQGVKAGVPDLCLPVPRGNYHGLFIEMKTKEGKTSAYQDIWLRDLAHEGYRTAVCHGFDEARLTIEKYMEKGE